MHEFLAIRNAISMKKSFKKKCWDKTGLKMTQENIIFVTESKTEVKTKKYSQILDQFKSGFNYISLFSLHISTDQMWTVALVRETSIRRKLEL